ncbi:dipeptidase [Roseimaritima sediminicola]|uniref:dipeptidase n=1 Tax=Roseimaritima sediminicola TaxID=2662066 RepID=UPI0012983787|nr:dipeptidase [Roseimaritima sediminicola]
MNDPSTEPIKNIENLLDQKQQAHTEDLLEWLRIASVSSDPQATDRVREAGRWVENRFQAAGLEVQWIETQGHPMVYAETPAVPGAPVALVYGHYDVQPPEPLDHWITPPFQPDIRDGNIYARGATDDKGQVLTHIQAVLRLLETGQPLPLQVKFLIEGEEEVGSENLERMLPELADRLACDVIVISDSSQFAEGQPAITYGLRGIATFELTVQGPQQDLHSGSFGGAVRNPGVALCQLIASMIDDSGRIQLDGFYDDVLPLSEEEREQFAALPFSEADFARSLGVDALAGEEGYTALERKWARPTLDVNGLTCGHQGPGVKTIIPAVASAKLSCRLVPNQDPEKIADALERHVAAHCPEGVRASVERDHGAPGLVASLDSPYVAAAKTALGAAFGKPPVMIREGGSIPIVQKFQETLGADCLLLGWGLADDNAHSPNEKFCLADYHRGIKASAHLWRELGKLKPEQS